MILKFIIKIIRIAFDILIRILLISLLYGFIGSAITYIATYFQLEETVRVNGYNFFTYFFSMGYSGEAGLLFIEKAKIYFPAILAIGTIHFLISILMYFNREIKLIQYELIEHKKSKGE